MIVLKDIVIIFLITIIALLIFFIKKKKIKSFFSKKIESVNLDLVSPIFNLKKITNNLSGPNEDVIIKSFCINSNNKIVGMTSDYEAWIISALSKKSINIFEFGTCSGKTTYLMALNSPETSKIFTLTLDPKKALSLNFQKEDNKVSFKNMINESIYEKFLFSGTNEEKKIKVILKNSLEFDEKIYQNFFDLIFIDGGHTYSVVKNDSEKAFKMIKNNGIILWHDYVPGKESAKNIVKYINEISKIKKISHINNTSLCFYKKI